ncbi:hypothetical protein C8J57DRAFT_1733349 [Mycena rebaudengoi]|nr:hypothetical protein C8J57DRAFT_1733349 [Mycena rebaudengoi]
MDIREAFWNTSVRLGSVVYMPAGWEIVGEVACTSVPQFVDFRWRLLDGWDSDETFQVMESGWTRVNSSDTQHKEFIPLLIRLSQEAWLAQANYIFNCTKIPSKYSDYGFIYYVEYTLTVSEENDIPHGYLFLCPLQDLQGNSPLEFIYPACPAYWSLDLSGAQRLGPEEAERLGFPSFALRIAVHTTSWDDLVYAGIREFHQAKGIDPYSQDVARELGFPLYEICVHETEVPDGEMPNGAYCEEVTSHEPTERNETSCEIDDADMLEPTLNWNLFMGA